MAKPLSDTDKLAGICFKFIKLYEQWQSDRRDIQRRWEAFEAISKEFQTSLDQVPESLNSVTASVKGSLAKVEAIAPQIKTILKDSMNEAFDGAATKVSDVLEKTISKEVFPAIKQLKKHFEKANTQTEEAVKKIHNAWELKSNWNFILSIISGAFAGVAISFLIYAYGMPHYDTYRLSADQLLAMNRGTSIAAALPFMSKEDKKQYDTWLGKGDEALSQKKTKED